MLPQEDFINRIRRVCLEDDNITAAMLHGSFPQGRADIYSDLDVYVYVKDDAFDKDEWLGRIASVIWHIQHDFGFDYVVFEGLIRGEFYFRKHCDMESVLSRYCDCTKFPSLESTLLVDKTGNLAKFLQPYIGEPPPFNISEEEIEALVHHYLFFFHTGLEHVRRGHYMRALDFLIYTHGYINRMARLLDGATSEWFSVNKHLEHDLSPEFYARFVSCTSSAEPDSLRRAYRNSWVWVMEMLPRLRERATITVPEELISALNVLVIENEKE